VQEAGRGQRYGFGAIRTLPGLPEASEAAALLRALALHPGVLAVMRQRRWFVPELAEMYPSGKVGVDPVCVLGLNVNSGAQIQLRVRTDDLLGFRKQLSILEVLYHELAHNLISPHTAEFYALVSSIKKEAEASDWRTSSGHVLGGPRALHSTYQREEPAEAQRPQPLLQHVAVLGGASAAAAVPLRELVASAALARAGGSQAAAPGPAAGSSRQQQQSTEAEALRPAEEQKREGQ
jgi:hypothetical protein